MKEAVCNGSGLTPLKRVRNSNTNQRRRLLMSKLSFISYSDIAFFILY